VFGVCGILDGGRVSQLHHSFYAPTGDPTKHSEDDANANDRARAERRATIEQIAIRVGSEVNFSTTTAVDTGAAASSDGHDETRAVGPQTGLFRAVLGAVGMSRVDSASRCMVLWSMVGALVTFFAIPEDENLPMVQAALAAVTNRILAMCPASARKPTELLLLPEQVAAIEQFYLPCGLITIGNLDLDGRASTLLAKAVRCSMADVINCAAQRRKSKVKPRPIYLLVMASSLSCSKIVQ